MTAIIIAFAMISALFVWAQIGLNRAERRLKNLRRNAWVRNELGRLVRFDDASQAKRDAAEQG